MKDPVFTGVCTALITPFDRTGAVDFTAFAYQIERQILSGVPALCVCGTTGESAVLSQREHDELVDFCVRKAAGRCKVIAGTGSNDTVRAKESSRRAKLAGADAALLVTPYYNKTTQAGLIRHYETIADAVDLPLILYNVPSRTGLSFTAETYQVLSRVPNINGVKEASGNFALVVKTMDLCGEALNVWSGNDNIVVPMMALGAKGVISAVSNLIPAEFVSLTQTCMKNDLKAAGQMQVQMDHLLRVLYEEVNPIPLKAAMEAIGLDSGVLRLPLVELSGQNRSKLLSEMEKSGAFFSENTGLPVDKTGNRP